MRKRKIFKEKDERKNKKQNKSQKISRYIGNMYYVL
jgi:hypothetical protein